MSDGGREQELIERWRKNARIAALRKQEAFEKGWEPGQDINRAKMLAFMACADELEALLASPGSENEQQAEWLDNYEKHISEIAAALGVRLNGSEHQWSEATREIIQKIALLSASPGSVSDQGWRDEGHPPIHADEHGDWAAANAGVGARIQKLERALGNCYMMSKREIARMLNRGPMDVGIASDKITLERWQHVKRFCEEAGQTSSILRASLPTEITDGSLPAPPVSPAQPKDR